MGVIPSLKEVQLSKSLTEDEFMTLFTSLSLVPGWDYSWMFWSQVWSLICRPNPPLFHRFPEVLRCLQLSDDPSFVCCPFSSHSDMSLFLKKAKLISKSVYNLLFPLLGTLFPVILASVVLSHHSTCWTMPSSGNLYSQGTTLSAFLFSAPSSSKMTQHPSLSQCLFSPFPSVKCLGHENTVFLWPPHCFNLHTFHNAWLIANAR